MTAADWIPVIVSVIAAIGSVCGVILTTNKAGREMDAKLEQTQAVFEAHVVEQIKQLTDKVEKHNTVIERTYALEKAAELQGAELRRHEKRIEILEKKEG